MGFNITYNDEPGKNMYANLFDAADLTKAWNRDTLSFDTFTLISQENFALPLIENKQRIGFYSYTVDQNISAVVEDDYYLIEIRERFADSYDRTSDTLFGSKQFFWNGTREIGLLSPSDLTAQNIWEYIQRTLTENSSGDSDLTVLVDIIRNGITINPQAPRIGQNGTAGPSSTIRVL